MTRDAGQITPRQAYVGGLLLIVAAASLVAVLDVLIDRREQRAPLEAPAEPAPSPCPEQLDAADSAPPQVTAEQLIECPDAYDGLAVRYRGEAVRAVLRRGDRAWVQLNDDPYAVALGPLPEHRTAVGGNSGLAVSISAAVADRITQVGDYRHRGDIIQVTGTFHRADPADGGGPTIQAETAVIQQAGRSVHHSATPRRAVAAAAMAASALGLSIISRLSRRR